MPEISKEQALVIAQAVTGLDIEFSDIQGHKPINCHIYGMPNEPSWFVRSPWNDGRDGVILRSSRILLISKTTGKILYDGSANDEG